MADLRYLVSSAFDAMQHGPPLFLNYTTDQVRRHQRRKVAEEIIIPAFLAQSDQTDASLSPRGI